MRPQVEVNQGILKQLKTLSTPRTNKQGTVQLISQIFIESTGTMRTTLSAIDRARTALLVKSNEPIVLKFGKEMKNGQNVFKGIYVKRTR